MALVSLPGGLNVPIGPNIIQSLGLPATGSTLMDAANEAAIMIGHVYTSDEGSHTIDTTGSSSLAWRSSSVTFANGGTTVKIGLATVLTTAGPPARANNVADVITFDVSKSLTGGGGIAANGWNTHVPDAGSKTIAHGDLVAFAIQMTARAGADSVRIVGINAGGSIHLPLWTEFTGAAYSVPLIIPNAIITFSDGSTGYFAGSMIFSTLNTQTWNSGSASNEFGQLFDLPFPYKVYGLYGWVDPDGDFDAVLYSDPLGSPVAVKTVSMDSNVVASSNGRYWQCAFAQPYSVSPNQKIAAIYKPGASSISTYFVTLASAGQRVSQAWGTRGYGISRASGAFADTNSSLDHYYIGLIIGAFEHGVQPVYNIGI